MNSKSSREKSEIKLSLAHARVCQGPQKKKSKFFILQENGLSVWNSKLMIKPKKLK